MDLGDSLDLCPSSQGDHLEQTCFPLLAIYLSLLALIEHGWTDLD